MHFTRLSCTENSRVAAADDRVLGFRVYLIYTLFLGGHGDLIKMEQKMGTTVLFRVQCLGSGGLRK